MLDQLLNALNTNGNTVAGGENQITELLGQLSPEQRTQLQTQASDGQGGFDLGKISELLQNGQLQQLLGNIDLGNLQQLLGNLDFGNLQNLFGDLTDGTPPNTAPSTEHQSDGLAGLIDKIL